MKYPNKRLTNHKFGRYVLVEKIAQGGMAEVYRAKYRGEGDFIKDVAVKRILPYWSGMPDFIKMLCDEAVALVNLQHQNIVQVYELGRDGDAFYISMEYVDGINLKIFFQKFVAGGETIPLKFVCFIIAEILKALEFAHNKTDKSGLHLKIIHRDISPPNVLLSFNGEVKVADFGIAKGTHRSFETAAVQVKGRYAYMSPEQAAGHTLDNRSDLYSVGVILYELITLKRLHDAPDDLLALEKVRQAALPDKWEHIVPMGIRPIVRRALKAEAGQRYQSAAEFLNDLNRFTFANKHITHQLEFSEYLKKTFHGEYNKGLKKECDHEYLWSDKPRFAKVCRIGLATLAVLVFGITNLGGHQLHIQGEKNVKIVIPVISPAKKIPEPLPDKEVVKAVKIESAILNIYARPWGYVYIQGHVERGETPVRGIKLMPGEYEVRVNYEPENRWLMHRLNLGASTRATCMADFQDKGRFLCRTAGLKR